MKKWERKQKEVNYERKLKMKKEDEEYKNRYRIRNKIKREKIRDHE